MDAYVALGVVGVGVAGLGWTSGIAEGAAVGIGSLIPFGLGSGFGTSGGLALGGKYYLKLQDGLMMAGGAILLFAALRAKTHRALFAILGFLSLMGGLSGVAIGWDGNV